MSSICISLERFGLERKKPALDAVFHDTKVVWPKLPMVPLVVSSGEKLALTIRPDPTPLCGHWPCWVGGHGSGLIIQ